MTKPREFYTPKELKELIDHAQARGVLHMKVPGFEVSWAPPAASHPEQVGEAAVRTRPPESFTPPAGRKLAVVPQGVQKVPQRKCPGCGGPLKSTAKIGHVCVSCYRANQKQPPTEPPESEVCDVHNAEKIVGRWGDLYCHECWAEKRRAEGTWRDE